MVSETKFFLKMVEESPESKVMLLQNKKNHDGSLIT